MPKDYKKYFKDILEAIEKVQKHTALIPRDVFPSNTLILEYVNRKLGIIGEAASKIPKNILEQYPVVEWKKIIGLRNILIHDYYKTDPQIIWDIIHNDLPILEEKVKQVLKKLEAK